MTKNIYIPSRSKEAVSVWKRGAELLEIAVKRRSEALECHSKLFVESLKDRNRQRPLQTRPLVHSGPKHHLWFTRGQKHTLMLHLASWLVTNFCNLSITWYLLIRHHTRDRNFSNLVSSMQLYRYKSSCSSQRNKGNKTRIQSIQP